MPTQTSAEAGGDDRRDATFLPTRLEIKTKFKDVVKLKFKKKSG